MPYLMILLTHDDPRVRRRAAEALGRLQDAGAFESLVIALRDRDRTVQQAVIGALGAIGDPRAIPPLRQLRPLVDRQLRAAIEDAQRAIAASRDNEPY
jgi:HEAT repeat protein